MGNWSDKRWLDMAALYAEGSKDPSTKVGCVLVRPDKTPASWGTNGFPHGIADTEERLNDRPTKYDLTIHAELNALLFAAERVAGYTCYSTFAPCIRCAMNLVQAKVCRVVFPASDNERWAIEQKRSIDHLLEANIIVTEIGDSFAPPVHLVRTASYRWIVRAHDDLDEALLQQETNADLIKRYGIGVKDA